MRCTPRSRRATNRTAEDEAAAGKAFLWVVAQLALVDLVFSLDSIITAIGMAQDLEIMIAAVVIAMIVMYVASGPVSRFVADHPTTKMLALAFLVLIGVALVADGFDVHIPRGYIYFAMAFAAGGRGRQRDRRTQPPQAPDAAVARPARGVAGQQVACVRPVGTYDRARRRSGAWYFQRN